MYDLIIIGAGPAGLTASIYASRYKLNHLIIGKIPGGLVLEAHKVENYPGFRQISGMELMQKIQEHAEDFRIKVKTDEVVRIEKKPQRTPKSRFAPTGQAILLGEEENSEFEVITRANEKYKTKSIILALGTQRKKLNVPGEEKFLGRGVSYCAICDAMFFKNKVVAVVGQGAVGVEAALVLEKHAQKVYLIYRNIEQESKKVLEEIKDILKTELILDIKVMEVKGEQKVERIILDKEYKGSKELEVQGLFIEIGSVPAIGLARQIGVEVDGQNCIKIDSGGATNVPGVYAAGDITTGSNKLRQIITAAAEGAVAVTSVYKYLKSEAHK